MWTRRYAISVILITLITLSVGVLLWNEDEPQKLDLYESWSRGPEDAVIRLDAFVDFT